MPVAAAAPLVMLHLGLGAFHRAHQALYLHRLIEGGDASWVLAAGNIRDDQAGTLAGLQAQGGAYTLETVTPAGERSYTRISAIRTVVPHEPTLAGLVLIGADPATRIISFTVTEAGYYLDDRHRLHTGHPELAADLQAAREGRSGGTIYAALTAILRARRAAGAGPVTLINCDNLRSNGERLRSGLLEFIHQAGDTALRAWVGTHTTCPNTMVDRITPRPTPDVRQRVKAATGWDDAVPVTGESYMQWVIEDDFCNGRPAWEKVGVQMVDSVAPYEEAKIRILNASHACIAWAGTLAGHGFIHEGVRDDRIRRLAYDYVTQDVIPCLTPSPIALASYRDVVLERFSNPALRDTNQRVAADGFAKIPGFIAPTVRDRLRRGESIAAVAVLPALFLAFLQQWSRGAIPYRYEDQAMDPAVARAICSAADPVRALCSEPALWGTLAGDERLVAGVRAGAQVVAAACPRKAELHRL